MEACLVPAIFRRHSPRSPSFCKAAARMRLLPRSGDLTTLGSREDAPPGSLSTTTSPGATGAHELRFGTNTRIFRLNDYDFGAGNGPDRDLHHPAAIHLWSRIHGNRDFPHVSERTLQLPQSRSLRAGHLEGDQEADVDLRDTRYFEFQSIKSASAYRSSERLFRFHLA